MSDIMQSNPDGSAAQSNNKPERSASEKIRQLQDEVGRHDVMLSSFTGPESPYVKYPDMMAEITALREQQNVLSSLISDNHSASLKNLQDISQRVSTFERSIKNGGAIATEVRERVAVLEKTVKDHEVTSASQAVAISRLNEGQYALDERMGELEQEWEERGTDEYDDERIARIEKHLNYMEYEGVLKLSQDHNLLVGDVQELSRTTKACAIFGIGALFVAGIALGRSL